MSKMWNSGKKRNWYNGHFELDHLGIFSENEKTVKIIEWPDLIKTPLTNKLEIHFEYGENDKERKMKIYAIGKWKDFENEI